MIIRYASIGTIRTPYKDPVGMPIQPNGARGVRGTVELYPEYRVGLEDISGFSHLYLLYHFHEVSSSKLTVMPFLDPQPHGIFATRSPPRPNPIGISVVRLLSVEGCTLQVEDVDMLDGTPLLDVKPYVPDFDCCDPDRIGWYVGRLGGVSGARSDDRFQK